MKEYKSINLNILQSLLPNALLVILYKFNRDDGHAITETVQNAIMLRIKQLTISSCWWAWSPHSFVPHTTLSPALSRQCPTLQAVPGSLYDPGGESLSSLPALQENRSRWSSESQGHRKGQSNQFGRVPVYTYVYACAFVGVYQQGDLWAQIFGPPLVYTHNLTVGYLQSGTLWHVS